MAVFCRYILSQLSNRCLFLFIFLCLYTKNNNNSVQWKDESSPWPTVGAAFTCARQQNEHGLPNSSEVGLNDPVVRCCSLSFVLCKHTAMFSLVVCF